MDEAQLGAAQGWVRCGQCMGAFDASARLWSEPDDSSPQVSWAPQEMDRDPADAIGAADAEPEAGPEPFGERGGEESLDPAELPPGPVEPPFDPAETFPDPVERFPAPVEPSLDPIERSSDPYPERPLGDERLLPSVSLGEVDIEVDLESVAPGPVIGDVRGVSAAHAGARPGRDRVHEGRDASRQRRSREQAILDRIEGRDFRRGRRWASGACIVLVLLLAAQYAWVRAGDLAAAFPVLGPALDELCEVAGCETRRRTGDDGIRVVSREMRPHAEYSGALSVRATLENRSLEARPFPVVVLVLYGRDGRAVASRAFEAAEYLDGGAAPPEGLKPGRRVGIALDLAAPAEVTVGFDLRLI